MSPRRLAVFSVFLLLGAPALLVADSEPPEVSAGSPAVVAYYFHGDVRCRTCLLLEEMTLCAVRDSFPESLGDGSLGLEVVNFQDEGKQHFADSFDLKHQSVVLASYEEDKIRRWKNLEQIWELYDKPRDFDAYIVAEINSFLDDGGQEPGSD